MSRQTDSLKRAPSTRNSGARIKAIIMAASVAATIGGWGMLAAGQVSEAAAGLQLSPQVTNSSSTTIQNNPAVTNQSTLSQSTVQTAPLRSFARTRSSR